MKRRLFLKRSMAAMLLVMTMFLGGCSRGTDQPGQNEGSGGERKETDGGGQSSSVSARTRTDELIVGWNNNVDNIDPHGQSSAPAGQIVRQIYDNLVMRDETYEIVPMLAESFEQIDAQSVRFKLREGVLFHNGEELTARDVLFSLGRGAESAFSKSMLDFIDAENSEIIDDYNFILKFHIPFAPGLANLTHPSGGIMNEKYTLEAGDRIATEPCGTGPFKVDKFVIGDRIEMSAHEDYYGGPANFSKFTIRFLVESSIRSIAIESGDVDIALELVPSDLERLRKNQDIYIEQAPSVLINWVAINNSKEPFTDVRVRKALAHALDIEEICNAIYSGTGQVATGALASGMWGYLDRPVYEYDPEKAQSLLAEAGYGDGFSLTIMTDETQTRIDMAEIMQYFFAQAGINAEVSIVERAKYLEDMANGNYDLTIGQWNPHSGDPDHAYFSKFHSENLGTLGNSTFYINPEVDELIELGRTTIDQEKRTEYYQRIQEIMWEECPIIPIQESDWIHARRTDVGGYYAHRFGGFRYYNIFFE